jgi:uncharacterized protein YjeT (DUF2065 family)
MHPHRYSQISLYYLAGYLVPGGLALVMAPELALRLLLSNGDYGEIMPRLAGFLMLAIGTLVVQFIRLGIHALYPTAIVIRLFLCAGT